MVSRDNQRLTVRPAAAIPGARVDLLADEPCFGGEVPEVTVAGVGARVVFASPSRLGFLVPDAASGGWQRVQAAGVSDEALLLVGWPIAPDVHQVDSPVFDGAGNLYVTDSGSRGEQVPVSVFRVTAEGVRQPFVSGIVNATSLAFDAGGDLFVSSRFEGTVYRVRPDGSHVVAASELGVPCGLAFAPDGELLVGDRSGSVLRVERAGRARLFASLPPSPAAYHLAVAADGTLFVSVPTLASSDSVFRIDANGRVEEYFSGLGRPQGLGFDARHRLCVCDALAGASGVFRLDDARQATLVAGGTALVGLAFDPSGALAVCTNDTVYRLEPARVVAG